MASTAVAMLAKAVNMTTASPGQICSSFSRTTRPSSAPSLTSRKHTSKPSVSTSLKARGPLGASTASCPMVCTAMAVVLRMLASSSTMRIRIRLRDCQLKAATVPRQPQTSTRPSGTPSHYRPKNKAEPPQGSSAKSSFNYSPKLPAVAEQRPSTGELPKMTLRRRRRFHCPENRPPTHSQGSPADRR